MAKNYLIVWQGSVYAPEYVQTIDWNGKKIHFLNHGS
jgi:hypothetical protein